MVFCNKYYEFGGWIIIAGFDGCISYAFFLSKAITILDCNLNLTLHGINTSVNKRIASVIYWWKVSVAYFLNQKKNDCKCQTKVNLLKSY